MVKISGFFEKINQFEKLELLVVAQGMQAFVACVHHDLHK